VLRPRTLVGDVVQGLNELAGQLEILARQDGLQLSARANPHDRCDYPRPVSHPGQRDLCRAHVHPFRGDRHRVNDLIGLLGEVKVCQCVEFARHDA